MFPFVDLYLPLRTHFGPLHGPEAQLPWWPIFGPDRAFEILVGAVVVQQTRWEVVEAAMQRLIAAEMLNPPALAHADPAAIVAHIRPAAFYSQKAEGLRQIAQHLCTHYAGSMAQMLAQPTATLRPELLALPRIGPETCDVVLLYAGAHPIFVIDEYTRRLFERIWPQPHAAKPIWRTPYEKLRTLIEDQIQAPIIHGMERRDFYADFHAQINEVCVRYCRSRPRCDGPPARRIYSVQAGRESYLASDAACPLREMCGWYKNQKGTC
ncbi:HhH-GPD family protein [Oscillochloris trichoides DG-6]|uniref:HhH-GPD family protein n=1 Tax=Oscillochloris trichoides DG-6 TaxID=765420 RepID=E1IIN0_9CHLR|nr:base excision DNA repair protein [Oscillochloris trichoides]EFO78936.1 HhH-GPD family protein [Oscillochloris trichoides DG-6]